MKSHGWSIRRKFTALLLLPLVSLAALCAYAADLSLGNALTLEHVDTIGSHLAAPLGRAVVALEAERRDAVVETAVPGSDSAALSRDRGIADHAVAAFLKQSRDSDVRDAENDTVRTGVDNAVKSLGTLSAVRRGVAAHTMSKNDVLTAYTAISASIAEALRGMTLLPDQDAQDFGQALYIQVPAGDRQSQEDALISAAAASPAHRLGVDDYKAVVQDIGAQRVLNAQALAQLPAPQRAPLLKLAAPGGAVARVSALEDQLIEAGPHASRLPFSIGQWRAAFDTQTAKSSGYALDDISLVFTRTGPPAHRAFVELILAGLLGLTALVVSVLMSLRMARSLLGDIGRLRTSSRNLTEDQLRDVVGRLRRGESVDVDAGMTRQVFVNREMGELGAAFDALQLTAVELAREDVRLHEGISRLFVNLARRSQVLIHRQLGMLDEMERHEEDARALNRLFELDQLATRMRRYAESLLIVSGTSPGRFWRRPVPVVDVVRGGIAETEQYARVVVMPVPAVGVQGRPAADVIHLLAELIENAEAFSSADSEVRVSVGTAATGLVVEIDDRGVGMPPEELAAANERLGASLEVSTLDSTRLGLVTVGRLAQRHHIDVTLRRSPYGGVSAVVLIPEELLEWDTAALETPAGLPSAAGPGPPPPRRPGRAPRAAAVPAAPAVAPVAPDAPVPPPAPPRPAGPHPGGTPYATGSYAGGSSATGSHASGSSASGSSATGSYATGSYETGSYETGSYAPPPVDPAHGFPEGEDTVDGLPRRVPQASLAGELAAESAAVAGGQLMDWDNTGQEQHGYVGGVGWGGPHGQSEGRSSTPSAQAGSPAPGPGAYPAATPAGPRTGGTYSRAGGARTGDGTRAGAAPRTPSGSSPYPAGRPYPAEPAPRGGWDRTRAYEDPAYEDPADRPARVRSMMSALQAGATRARSGQYPAPGDGGDRP
ncbi:nitrate- and nitrite sensing domain-containing protein [Streptomyces sp. 8L]|uniref:nitrate- and nitrite sensing domain-containing protein n=1 Tax=Streptomyces sp. 8L TaxID=2877242 RepID=UPI001CD209D2|nr:nitrate- and nitrite sensing domain-containing protein [Streptomyces sp. 8L]MCA1223780.1 nitrate- and nitrite sensing domain-containing protein [Streptomyces sp. 8L]